MSSDRMSKLLATLVLAVIAATIIKLATSECAEAELSPEPPAASTTPVSTVDARRPSSEAAVAPVSQPTDVLPPIPAPVLEPPEDTKDAIPDVEPPSPPRTSIRLTGRAVLPPGDVHAGRARVVHRVQVGTLIRSNDLRAGRDGRFEIAVSCDAREVVLDVHSSDGSRRTGLVVEGPFIDDRDLGDLLLDRSARLEIRVRDSDFAPIPDARAELDGAFDFEVADADGRIILALGDAGSFKCWAPGFAVSTRPIPRDVEPGMVVTLERCARLRLIAENQGGSFSLVKVELTADEPFFPTESSTAFGNYAVSYKMNGRAMKMIIAIHDPKGVILSEVTPGVNIRARLVDGGTELSPSRNVSVSVGEWRDEVFEFNRVARTLVVTVLDTEGRPVPNAIVTIEDEGDAMTGPFAPWGTTTQGEMTFTHVYRDAVDIKVVVDGREPRIRRGIPLVDLKTDYRFILD